jgi:hypothetical protein
MARIVLHTAISAALTLVTFYSSPGLAADRDHSGKSFQFVAPKAPVAQFVPPKAQFVAPKAGRTGSGTITAQFVAPKAIRKVGLAAARSRPNLSRRKPIRPKPR